MLSVIAQYSKSNEDSLHDTQHNLADHEPLYTLKKFAATWTDKLHLSMHQCRKSGWLKRVFTTFAAFPADKKTIWNTENGSLFRPVFPAFLYSSMCRFFFIPKGCKCLNPLSVFAIHVWRHFFLLHCFCSTSTFSIHPLKLWAVMMMRARW